MPQTKRQMHLAVFWLGTGNHIAGWRMPGAFDSNCSWPIAEAGVKIAERGRFDLFFLADSLVSAPNDHPSMQSRLEPTTTIAALSLVARKIGFGCTVSTTFSDPFSTARVFQSLAHLTGSRIAWNVVTTNAPEAYLNFSRDANTEHDERYRIAEEFVDVVRGLWRGWDTEAVLRDRASGVFADRARIHPLEHKGRYFKVKGPLNVERPPQGDPLLIQAGGSEQGQDLSARTADIVFSVVNGDKDEAKAAYDSLKARMARFGREPHMLKLLPGVMPIIGRTESEARAQLDQLQSWVSPTTALRMVSLRLGYDISKHDLDGPVPELPADANSQSFARTLFAKARRENLTLRDLYNIAAAARGHWVIWGTPTRIADTLQEWFEAGLADGFMIQPAYFPGAFDDFVDLVVPELQRRGLFRRDYAGATLRSHLFQSEG
ncbi:MAG TPA: LLM class flavin-dependent oxidoreductase [Hyphomicrobiaceae bacterium]|nr:LLM class flavin-dependent oxidoreductase [Hyphomicrobiaceae bacterium]